MSLEFVIKECMPLLNTPVIIKTNWKRYIARLVKSPFGGVEFRVFDSSHSVQLTTVLGWTPVS